MIGIGFWGILKFNISTITNPVQKKNALVILKDPIFMPLESCSPKQLQKGHKAGPSRFETASGFGMWDF